MSSFLHTQLRISDFKDAFAKERLRVTSVLSAETSKSLSTTLQQDVSFETALFFENQNVMLSDEAWSQLPDKRKREIRQQIMANAADGKGFIYGRKKVDENEQNSALKYAFETLNSESFLTEMRKLSGYSEINYASMQATRFLPGQFITRHNDIVESEGRRLAYVFNLSPVWHPDWGGLLQFFDTDGTSTESWTPEFNTLSLFGVKNIHSVTYVTPFAKSARYALTGWFGVK
ncbi:2OG-Fe(II) oxygenase family protein [Salinimonas chungwhensis]|uniref:2OG-Fe(II) oxygenase family protein n=1 Tax=Salinimonas chungwhensis TaxID=265425 RepID=UPI00036F5DC1|nr:2OG-Fe(II) oxygenase family protein [Salinimonas chungwhensis]